MSPCEFPARYCHIVDQFSIDSRSLAFLFNAPLSVYSTMDTLTKSALSRALGHLFLETVSAGAAASGRLWTRFRSEIHQHQEPASWMTACIAAFSSNQDRVPIVATRPCAIFVEGLPLNQVAHRFGYRPSALRSLVSRFRSGCRAGSPPPSSFSTDLAVPAEERPVKTKAVQNSRKLPTVEC